MKVSIITIIIVPFIYCNQYSVFLRQASYTLPYNSEVYNCNIRCLFNYMEVSKKIIISLLLLLSLLSIAVLIFHM